jgi:hypothetical protein
LALLHFYVRMKPASCRNRVVIDIGAYIFRGLLNHYKRRFYEQISTFFRLDCGLTVDRLKDQAL